MRLRTALMEANGAEWEFARHESPFIPDDLGAMTEEALWHFLLLPVKESNGPTPIAVDEFAGRYLPLGDDYSGEIVLLDLKTAPKFRVLITNGSGYDRISCYEEVAASFEDYYRLCTEPPPERPIWPGPRPTGLPNLPTAFATRKIVVEGFSYAGTDFDGATWLAPKEVPGEGYHLRVKVERFPVATFGSVALRVGGEEVLLTVRDGALVTTPYKNSILASEAAQAIGPTRSLCLARESPRLTLKQAKIHVYETRLATFTSPPVGGGVKVAVLAVQDDNLNVLELELLQLRDERQANEAVKHLLSFGFDWFQAKT